MFHASPIMYLFGAFFAVFGVVIVGRAVKPSCRVCLNRRFCPHRKSSFLDRRGYTLLLCLLAFLAVGTSRRVHKSPLNKMLGFRSPTSSVPTPGRAAQKNWRRKKWVAECAVFALSP
jgi:hypothetical protein